MTALSGDGYLSFFVLSHKNFNPQILNFVLPTRIIMLFNYCNQNELAYIDDTSHYSSKLQSLDVFSFEKFQSKTEECMLKKT